jgi:GT2 family glycosyltransferase
MELIVSVVVNDWDSLVLSTCLSSLSASLDQAKEDGELKTATLFLSYNGQQPLEKDPWVEIFKGVFHWPFHLQVQPNLGYGGTNNRVLKEQIFTIPDETIRDRAILVLNPDVRVETKAISQALRRLAAPQRVGLVCPRILDWEGRHETRGHKRYPSVAVLAARLLPPLLKIPALRRLNERYEYADQAPDHTLNGVMLCSGCFLLARRNYWEQLGGFDEQFFMYFEDFDLAVRGIESGWEHVYDPGVCIWHAGGGAGQKDWQHRRWFLHSACRFFNRHGWRLWNV